jgi:subtilisin family serine protease
MRAKSIAPALWVALLVAGGAGSAEAPYWVILQDRGPCAEDAAAVVSGAVAPTPRALARRERAARSRSRLGLAPAVGASDAGGTSAAGGASAAGVATADRDPCASYVAAVTATGATLRMRSRWLNAVSVDADSAALARIAALPFVTETRPVAAGERADAAAAAAPHVAAAPHATADALDLGPAEHQLDMLHVPEAHAMGFHGEGILIAVLDSGFDLTHEAFNLLEVRAQRDFINGDDDPSYDPRTDRPGQANHGTQVLSILAGYAPGRVVGPAYGADVILAKTERTEAEVPVEEDYWVAGLEWAEAMGADIATSSLSYSAFYHFHDMDGRTALTTRAANLALERGLLVFNAMGNQGPRVGRLGAPADAPGVVSVGAVDAQGRIARFSTAGPTWDRRVKPDVSAMGVQVAHARARTRDRYGRGNGTSYATPLVAGCAALVLQAHPDWGPEAVREALAMSADRAASPDTRYGWGIVNVRDAILYPQIEGRVTDRHTREPVARARVAWAPAGSPAGAAPGPADAAAPGDAPPRGEVRADSTGAYLIPNLPRGSYVLRVTADGYFEGATEPIEVPPGIGDVNVELRYRGE